MLLPAVLCLILPGPLAAASSKTASQKTTAARKSAAKPGTSTRRASARRQSRRVSYRYRLAQLRMQPERIEEIQAALQQAEYLQQDPNGKWDDATRAAMGHYQADNGFSVTGQPDAKSLMKLGLGPHALPEDADPNAGARASVDASTKVPPATPGDQPETRAPTTPNSPHQN